MAFRTTRRCRVSSSRRIFGQRRTPSAKISNYRSNAKYESRNVVVSVAQKTRDSWDNFYAIKLLKPPGHAFFLVSLVCPAGNSRTTWLKMGSIKVEITSLKKVTRGRCFGVTFVHRYHGQAAANSYHGRNFKVYFLLFFFSSGQRREKRRRYGRGLEVESRE